MLPLFIEVPVPCQGSRRLCICMLEISITPLSKIVLLVFGTVKTVCFCFCSSFYLYNLFLLRPRRVPLKEHEFNAIQLY